MLNSLKLQNSAISSSLHIHFFLGRKVVDSYRIRGPLHSQFVAVSEEDCPCSDKDDSGCKSLPECSSSMNENDLCEADQKLPDGNTNFNVNNCAAFYDVFRYKGGKTEFLMLKYPNINVIILDINRYFTF